MIARFTLRLRRRFATMMPHFKTSPVIRALIAIGLVLIISMLFPKGLEKTFEYSEGTVWNEEDLIAPFAFPIYRNPATVEREQHDAVRMTPLSFNRVDSVVEAVRDSARSLLARCAAACDRTLKSLGKKPTREAMLTAAASLREVFTSDSLLVRLQEQDVLELLQLRIADRGSRVPFRTLDPLIQRAITAVFARGVLDRSASSFLQRDLALMTKTVETLTPVSDFLDPSEVTPAIQQALLPVAAETDPRMRLVLLLLPPMIRPNIVIDRARTQIAVQAAIDRVPRMEGIVKQNERIVSRHERVTAEIKAKIDSYQRARAERAGNVNSIMQYAGRAGHTAVILFFLVIYLLLFRKRIFYDNSRLLILAMILLFPAVLAWLSFSIPVDGAVEFLILVPTAAMLAAIIFDSRVAFYLTVTASFLAGAIRGNDYSIILASLMAGSLALYTVRDIKHRTQIFRSLAFIMLGYGMTILFDGMQRAIPLQEIRSQLLYALANAVLSPVLTFGLLVFFERLFGIDTDLTLLELSDFNTPLLRDLAERAPGTFHHSVVMGTLAEAAAAAIGANPILARVGAYYHDIGKTEEPEYFVENFRGSQNVHDTLPPTESARRILHHVESGMRLARDAGLPQRIIDFIPAHHGTTLISYFFEREKAEHADTISVADFQYAGPKPTTKETAIVMLADTIEAAARAIEDLTVEKLEKLIDTTVSRRMEEGQLDDCTLTLHDITLVKKSFLNILTGIHHSRIKYPTEKEAEAARKLAERTERLLKLPPTAEALTRRLRKFDST